jgi:hypothetical protein
MENERSMPVKMEPGPEPQVKQEIINAPIGASMVPPPVGVAEDSQMGAAAPAAPASSKKDVIMTPEEAARARLQKGYALQPILPVTTPPPELVSGPGKRERKKSMHFGTAPGPAYVPPMRRMCVLLRVSSSVAAAGMASRDSYRERLSCAP